MNTNTFFGSIVIVGRHNVGKSTLFNSLLGKKISITSRRVRTTLHQIIGIHTDGSYQTIYIDTPGLCMKEKPSINCTIDRNIDNPVKNIDLFIFVVDSIYWTLDDEKVLNDLRKKEIPVILAVNKIDKVKKKSKLLPQLKFLSKKMNFLEIVPVSAETGVNISSLRLKIHKSLPESIHYYPVNYITAHSHRFIASEIIREKLMRFLGEELPYSTTVKIERFSSSSQDSHSVSGFILVKHEAQKKIVIGSKGSKIKTISIEARKDMQKIFRSSVFLELRVKLKSHYDHHSEYVLVRKY